LRRAARPLLEAAEPRRVECSSSSAWILPDSCHCGWKIRSESSCPKRSLAALASIRKTDEVVRVRRLQITIDEDLDAALARQAAEEGVSKAALIRRYVEERLRLRPVLADDPIWGLVGLVKGNPDDSVNVDKVVYGPRQSG